MPRSTNRKGRRGGKVLCWAALLFFFGQTVGGWLIDTVWTRVRNPFLHWHLDRMAALEEAPNIVCLGSSRFGSQLDETELTRAMVEVTGDPTIQVINASLPAGDPPTSEETLNRLLEAGVRPKFLVLEICPEVVGENNDWLRIQLTRQLDWTDAPAYLGELIRTSNLLRFLQARLLPLYMHRKRIMEELEREFLASQETNHVEETNPGGSRPKSPKSRPGIPWGKDGRSAERVWSDLVRATIHDPDEKSLVRSKNGLRDVHRFLRRYRPGGNSARALERILDRCRKEGIETILVDVPVSSHHRALYTQEIENRYQSYLKDLARRFRFRRIDFRAKAPDGLFMDNHHASSEGGRWISRRAALEFLGPMWLEKEHRVQR